MSDYIRYEPPLEQLEKQLVGNNKKLLKSMRKNMKKVFVPRLKPIQKALVQIANKNFATASFNGKKWTPNMNKLRKGSNWYEWKDKKRYGMVAGRRSGDTRLAYKGEIENSYKSQILTKGNQKDGFIMDIEIFNDAPHFDKFENGTNPMGYHWRTLPSDDRKTISMIDNAVEEAMENFRNKIESDMKKRSKR